MPSAICDGSDDIRFFTSEGGGGFLDTTYKFYGAYGFRFIAIDGQCHFWMSTRAGRVWEGTIADRSVLAAYEAESYGRLSGLASFSGLVCPDASSQLVWDPSGSIVGSTCAATAENTPAGWLDVLNGANALYAGLPAWAAPTTGTLLVLVLPDTGNSEDAVAWPLSSNPLAFPVNAEPYPDANSGAPVAPGSDAEELRAIWDRAEQQGVVFNYADASVQQVQISSSFRDEVPPKLRAMFDSIRQSHAIASGSVAAGQPCTSSNECFGLVCGGNPGTPDGATQCRVCVVQGSDVSCDENADCCGDLTCCTDCGDLSGTCIEAVDVCGACLAAGGVWEPESRSCLGECAANVTCFADACPPDCELGACGSCFSEKECWAAGCGLFPSEPPVCVEPEVLPVPCEVDASNPDIPGVSIHLEADSCYIPVGPVGTVFRYTVEITEPVIFDAPASQGCGSCTGLAHPMFSIGEGENVYCPECDLGCCAPTDAVTTSLAPGITNQTVIWDGQRWRGPSDTNAQPSGAFDFGTYDARVTVDLGSLGEVSATLQIVIDGPMLL